MGNQESVPQTQQLWSLPEFSSSIATEEDRGRAMAHNAFRHTRRNDMTIDDVLAFYEIPKFTENSYYSGPSVPNGSFEFSIVDARKGIQQALDEINEGVQL